MRKTIITFNQIIELNNNLQEKGINFKVHLHDACGNQSFTVEILSDSVDEDSYTEMEKEVTKYFEQKSIKIMFLENHVEFVIQ